MINLYIPLLAIISHEAMGSRTKGGQLLQLRQNLGFM